MKLLRIFSSKTLNLSYLKSSHFLPSKFATRPFPKTVHISSLTLNSSQTARVSENSHLNISQTHIFCYIYTLLDCIRTSFWINRIVIEFKFTCLSIRRTYYHIIRISIVDVRRVNASVANSHSATEQDEVSTTSSQGLTKDSHFLK